jgi:uncharacterized protein (UPF0335 family)
MANTAGIPGVRICSFIERVERIDEEIKAPNEGKKEVFAEAKGEGFNVKVLREILRLRRQDKDEREEQESVLDLHLRAMESAGSSHERAAQRQAGDKLPVVEGGLFSPRFNPPSMIQSAFDEFDDREGAPTRSHSSSFDQRRRPDTLRTAMATAFF